MTTETRQSEQFQADMSQLIHMVANSLYSNPEIFIRELISNSSDALEKLRCEGLGNDTVWEGDAEKKLSIWVDVDKEKKQVVIRDNGIGMSLEEMRENLGTVARSGTQNFIKKLWKS